MSAPSAVLQLHHRESFERTVTRALAAGALATLVQQLLLRAGLPLPLSPLVLMGVGLSAARGDRLDRLLVCGLALLLPALPFLLGLSPGWALGLGAAGTGALLVRARVCEGGAQGGLGGERPGALHHLLGAGLAAALVLGGQEVGEVLATRLASLSAPQLVPALVDGATLALFTSLSALAAHLALAPDPVEARYAQLLPQLSGELESLTSRALTTYRHCGQTLSALPREPARDELAHTLSRLTREALELAAEWAGVEAQLGEGAREGLAAERASLQEDAARARDPLARRQLELAATSLREEEARLEELELQRERVVARLRAHGALLERARVALLGLRSGQAQLKAATLSALARRLSAQAAARHEEGRLQEAVATGAELQQLEAQETKSSAPGPEKVRG